MGNDDRLFDEMKQVLIQSIRAKLQNYKPEPNAMPFHTRLLGKDRLALYSFIHSLNTNFGTSMFEPISAILGKSRFMASESQQVAGTQISSEAHRVIQRIMDDLATQAESQTRQERSRRFVWYAKKGLCVK